MFFRKTGHESTCNCRKTVSPVVNSPQPASRAFRNKLSGIRMLKKIVVINSKGGCGKTTLSTNLAGYYAAKGYPSALFDYDPQDSAARWLSQRSPSLPRIHGVAAAHPPAVGITRSFQMRLPPDTRRLVLDTPASLKRDPAKCGGDYHPHPAVNHRFPRHGKFHSGSAGRDPHPCPGRICGHRGKPGTPPYPCLS
jgi:hypothetical protein